LLNLGVWAVAVGPLLPERLGAGLLPAGRVMEAAAAVVFAANVWARVRASGLSPM